MGEAPPDLTLQDRWPCDLCLAMQLVTLDYLGNTVNRCFPKVLACCSQRGPRGRAREGRRQVCSLLKSQAVLALVLAWAIGDLCSRRGVPAGWWSRSPTSGRAQAWAVGPHDPGLVLLGRAQGSIYSLGKWVHKACSLLHSQQGPSQGGSSWVPLVRGRGHCALHSPPPPEHCTGSWHPRVCAPGLSLAAALVADQGARK